MLEGTAEDRFWVRLHKAIADARLSHAELARQTGLAKGTISAWKRNQGLPKGAALLQLPAILGVNGHWLLTGEGAQEPPNGQPMLARAIEASGARVALSQVERAVHDLMTQWTLAAKSNTPPTPAEVADALAVMRALEQSHGEPLAPRPDSESPLSTP